MTAQAVGQPPYDAASTCQAVIRPLVKESAALAIAPDCGVDPVMILLSPFVR
jgi:hypothetical protein